MPRLRIWLIALGAILATAVLAIWQVPQFLNWTNYRTTIEALASVTLGQPVAIRGPITLTLLPQPLLTAAQVNIGGDGAQEPAIHVEALRLRVGLWRLLGGRIDARELALRGPDLRIPWPTELRLLRARSPAWLASFTAQIEHGRLTVGRLAFTGIDATLASHDTGALTASGSAQFNGEDWHFTAQLTSVGSDGSAGLNVTLDGQGNASGLGASFGGQFAADGTLAGTISSQGPNLALLLPAPAVPFRADGRLTIGSGLAAVDNLALEIGGSPATGAVALRVAPDQRLDIALSASRMDLDAWLPVLLKATPTIAGIDLPIGIDFSAESAPLGGGTLQHVRAAFDMSDHDLTLRDGSVMLPGNGRLEMVGHIARGDAAHVRFEGDGTLQTAVLHATLQWLRDAAPNLLPARFLSGLDDGALRSATLSAHVMAAADGISLRRLTGKVDGTSVAGDVEYRHGEPATISADLDLDRLALDGRLAMNPPSLRDIARAAKGFDGELHLHVREVLLGATVARDVGFDAGLEGGTASLRRFSASIDGLRIDASGALDREARLTGGTFNVTSNDAAPLAAVMPSYIRGTPALWHGPLALAVQAAGPPDAMVLRITLRLADADLIAEPTVNFASGKWSGEFTLRHPGARRFLATLGVPDQAGLPDLPAWLGDGSLSLTAHLRGEPNRVTADSFDLTAAGLRANGVVALDLGGVEPSVSGQIRLAALPLPIPYGASEVPLPIAALRGWRGTFAVATDSVALGPSIAIRDAAATVTVAKDALRIDRFAGEIAGGRLTGSGVFDAATDPPSLGVHVSLDNAALSGPVLGTPIDLTAGSVGARADLTASGYSPATILATLSGHIAASVGDGVISGFDLSGLKQALGQQDPAAAEQAAMQSIGSGTTRFDRFEFAATVASGDLAFDTARLVGPSGMADATGDANFPSRALDIRVALHSALANAPEVAIHLTGPFDHPGMTPELANLARFVAERMH